MKSFNTLILSSANNSVNLLARRIYIYIYKSLQKSSKTDHDTLNECDQMRFIFQFISSCGLNTSFITMLGSHRSTADMTSSYKIFSPTSYIDTHTHILEKVLSYIYIYIYIYIYMHTFTHTHICPVPFRDILLYFLFTWNI